jgi:hypothetical protein
MIHEIEKNQQKSIEDIEKMYTKKLEFENERYLSLEAQIQEKEILYEQEFDKT